MELKLKLVHNNISLSSDCVKIKHYIYILFIIMYIYMYIVSSHELWNMLLGTEFAFIFRIRLVLGGASRCNCNSSVSPYDDGYLLYLQCKL